jgi:hypothetical protein
VEEGEPEEEDDEAALPSAGSDDRSTEEQEDQCILDFKANNIKPDKANKVIVAGDVENDLFVNQLHTDQRVSPS